MKIGIAGAGGVGGYFGSFLTAAGFDTHFLARGRHRHVMAEEGLQIHSGQGAFVFLYMRRPSPKKSGRWTCSCSVLSPTIPLPPPCRSLRWLRRIR